MRERNFGEIKKFKPQEDTLAEVIAKAEEIDKKNKARGGEGTVTIGKIYDGKGRIMVRSSEKDPLEK
ncbi:hypothetical protein K0B03_02420 [Patescibacteria group bacterium]|nr:hypothetical protein [Patescibacteria group bacterium]